MALPFQLTRRSAAAAAAQRQWRRTAEATSRDHKTDIQGASEGRDRRRNHRPWVMTPAFAMPRGHAIYALVMSLNITIMAVSLYPKSRSHSCLCHARSPPSSALKSVTAASCSFRGRHRCPGIPRGHDAGMTWRAMSCHACCVDYTKTTCVTSDRPDFVAEDMKKSK